MEDAATPMMQQYRRIRKELPEGVILFFRLGDFYEMFFEDAKTAAPILDVALTRRNEVPMCGVPYHAVESYLAKLIRAGVKVAICDQVEDATAAKGIVRREVTRIVTPGTITEENILEAAEHNYLTGVFRCGDEIGLAALDLSTGLFSGETLAGPERLIDGLRRLAPRECVIPAGQLEDPEFRRLLGSAGAIHLSAGEDWTFEYEAAYDNLVRHFGVHSLQGFGCEGRRSVVGAAGGVLYYVREQLRRQVAHIRAFRTQNACDYLLLDEATCANLDLVPRKGREGAPNLLQVLDVTKTPMGSRLLRDWILRPLASVGAIRLRHDALEDLCRGRAGLTELRQALSQVRDLERLITRIGAGTGNARDVMAVALSLAMLPAVKKALAPMPAEGRLRQLDGQLVCQPELIDLVQRAIVDEPPIALKEGGIIRPGYRPDLDELRTIASEGRSWLAEYQASEQKRTGIKTLKVRHNRVFGYYIEVSRGQVDHVPAEYVRKQTLVNAERFVTPELKEYENKIVGAMEKSQALEYELFMEVREAVVRQTDAIQAAAEAVAEADVLAALADRALAANYVRPTMTDGDRMHVVGGRHPVVEQMPDAERFVSNDTRLDCTDNQLIIITGPNMAGKSTYIRQVGMIVIMAQMGSFVPADQAEIAWVDRVFTRVGASDDLARGRSTFMVEMQETANILNNATPRSLIILDEIGRGTSTFDGISIAWAVAEYLHNQAPVKAKTLFATHYHELTDLALAMRGVKNYNVLVREKDDQIAFLRRIVPGGSDKSYGIQVARLAGMPTEVIDRAKEILANLEEGELGESGQPKIARHRPMKGRRDSSQMDLFGG